jgi:excisionase family DNA binding protein
VLYVAQVAPTFVSTTQVAKRCGVHPNTVYRWVDKGVLSPVRAHETAKYRFRLAEVEQLQRRLGLIEDGAA